MIRYAYEMTSSHVNRLKSWSWPQGAFALRLVVAALLALFVSKLLPGEHGFSAVISALIVVRPYQQGALKAGLMRMLATLIGIVIAFAATAIHNLGLNDYERLLLALAPLAVLVAYNSDYRSALIAAVLIMGAPAANGIASLAVVDVAVGRAVVVLPVPHKQAVADKAVRALADMITQLSAVGTPPSAKTEKAEARLRKSLLELSLMHRDNGKGHAEDDESGQIVRLVRHAQAVCILLRSQWRNEAGEGREAFCAALLEMVQGLRVQGLRSRQTTPLDDQVAAIWQSIPDVSGVENWMLRALAGDLSRIAQLVG